jgi:NAD(P)H dehydrogenase (quinone)
MPSKLGSTLVQKIETCTSLLGVGNRMSLIAIAYHSGYGHTKKVAEAIAAGMNSVSETQAVLLDVTQVESEVEGYADGWELLAAADGIVFGTPTYMGGPSGPFKIFADATVKIWFRGGWRDKIAAGFTNSGSNAGDKGTTLFYLATLAAQHEMIWVSVGIKSDSVSVNRNGYYLGLGTQSDNGPVEETPNASELDTASLFGVRFAEATQRWIRGNS